MTKARQKRPTYQPYATPDISQEPCRPFYPARTKAIETWKVLISSHKKPSPMDLSFQAWSFYNLRFLLAGGLAGAWAPFGGLSAQLAQLGLIFNMAAIENSTIAMTYSEHFRGQAAHLARQRAASVDWAHFLSEEDGVIKRNVLRGLGRASATMPKQGAKPPVTERVPKWPGKVKKGDKKGRNRKGQKGDQNNDWKGNEWKGNDWKGYRPNRCGWSGGVGARRTNATVTQGTTDQPASASVLAVETTPAAKKANK